MYITAWTAVSPYGLGREAFAEGVLARRRTAAAVLPGPRAVPDARACLVPDFDPRAVLGKKGTRAMNRVTGLAVTAVGALVGRDTGDAGDVGGTARADEPDCDTALVLGTTTGSVQSMMDFTRASLTGERPFDVEPAVIPNSVMNCAAAQCAIWHRLEGPNTTLACGRPSALLALAYARRLLLGGRARTVLCGAAEEYSSARAWLERRSRSVESAGSPVPLGEGAAVLRVELGAPHGALAEVLAVESRFRLPGTSVAEVVEAVARTAVEQAGIDRREVWAAVSSGLCDEETGVLGELFGARTVNQVPLTAELLGDTGAACAAFQLTATLAVAAYEAPEARCDGRIAVVTSVDREGAVTAAVLRMGGAI